MNYIERRTVRPQRVCELLLNPNSPAYIAPSASVFDIGPGLLTHTDLGNPIGLPMSPMAYWAPRQLTSGSLTFVDVQTSNGLLTDNTYIGKSNLAAIATTISDWYEISNIPLPTTELVIDDLRKEQPLSFTRGKANIIFDHLTTLDWVLIADRLQQKISMATENLANTYTNMLAPSGKILFFCKLSDFREIASIEIPTFEPLIWTPLIELTQTFRRHNFTLHFYPHILDVYPIDQRLDIQTPFLSPYQNPKANHLWQIGNIFRPYHVATSLLVAKKN